MRTITREFSEEVAGVKKKAMEKWGNCPRIEIYGEPDEHYSIVLNYTSDSRRIEWTVCQGMRWGETRQIIEEELLDEIKRVYASAESNVHTLEERFLEARDKFPFRKYLEHREETLYGEVLTWCRDYFGGPKDSMLAYMIIGYWQNKMECEMRDGIPGKTYVLTIDGETYEYFKSEWSARQEAKRIYREEGYETECYIMDDDCESWEDGDWVFHIGEDTEEDL